MKKRDTKVMARNLKLKLIFELLVKMSVAIEPQRLRPKKLFKNDFSGI